MHTTPLFFGILVATLFSAGVVTAQAAEGLYYNPYNAASPTGKTIGYELYRTIGCPSRELLGIPCPVPKLVDSDGDGVVDEKDKCPNTPTGRKVDAIGCELDGDGDGIVDGADACPAVYAQTADGCPLPIATGPAPAPAAVATAAPAAATERLVLYGVNFDYDKIVLRQEDIATLEQDTAALLQGNDGKVFIEVAGHTDSRGSHEYNIALSQRRAEAVRNYLVDKGVSADRLIPKGYGEAQPIANNETGEGRFKNRRVELVPWR